MISHLISKAKALPWYYWIAAALLPGGAILLWLKAKATPKPPVGTDYGNSAATVNSNIGLANTTAVTQNLVDSAKAQADALRAGLSTDPLAASLLNISPSLLTASTGPTAADNTAKKAALNADIASLQHGISAAAQGLSNDHFGGKSQDEYQAYVNGLNAQIAEDMTNLALLT
jgi:hypothetical protein